MSLPSFYCRMVTEFLPSFYRVFTEFLDVTACYPVRLIFYDFLLLDFFYGEKGFFYAPR